MNEEKWKKLTKEEKREFLKNRWEGFRKQLHNPFFDFKFEYVDDDYNYSMCWKYVDEDSYSYVEYKSIFKDIINYLYMFKSIEKRNKVIEKMKELLLDQNFDKCYLKNELIKFNRKENKNEV